MKRLFVATSLAVLAVPAFAAGISAPYEQSQVDRLLPTPVERASSGATRTAANEWADDYSFIAPAQ